MKKDTVLILERHNLHEKSTDVEIGDVSHRDFPLHQQKGLVNYGVVLFVDTNGRTKILKNKYGDEGERHRINQLIDMGETATQRYLEAENFLSSLLKKRFIKKATIKEYLKKVAEKHKIKP